ncbi:MAG: hypothetical protein KDI79_13520, partial [Anaerolineae bacterium]|nr:hypothetical protein [Anaerolineae bacterium]
MRPTFDPAAWQTANERDLQLRLARLRALLQRALGHASEPFETPPDTEMPSAAALVASLFNLSAFEADVLMLSAAAVMDSSIAALCAEMNGDPRRAAPTFGIAITILPNPHWSVLSPSAPLRYWRLLEPGPGEPLTRAPLRIEERVLHFLAGISCMDPHLESIFSLVPHPVTLSQNEPAEATPGDEVAGMVRLLNTRTPPVIALCGGDRQQRLATAGEAALACGLRLFTARAVDLPVEPVERHELGRRWAREAILSGSALLVECDGDSRTLAAFAAFAAEENFPVFLASDIPMTVNIGRPMIRFPLKPIVNQTQQNLWRQVLGDHTTALNGYIPTLTAQFRLSPSLIRAAAEDALAALPTDPAKRELQHH